MSHLFKNGIKYLKARYPSAAVLSDKVSLLDTRTQETLNVWPMIALDCQAGIKHRAICISNLGDKEILVAITHSIENIFKRLDEGVYLKAGNPEGKISHEIDTNHMGFSSRITIYNSPGPAGADQRRQILRRSVGALGGHVERGVVAPAFRSGETR